MDVTFDEVSAEVQRDEGTPSNAAAESSPKSPGEMDRAERLRAARAERIRARLSTF